MTKHARQYFDGADFLQLANNDIEKGGSILFNINKFGSNQNHSNSYKNFKDPMDVKIDGVYIVHMFEGTWWNVKNKTINVFKSKFGTSHNLTVVKDGNGYIGVSRLDKDTSRTRFMEKIGDCRSLVEYKFDSNFNLIEEFECKTYCFKALNISDRKFAKIYDKDIQHDGFYYKSLLS